MRASIGASISYSAVHNDVLVPGEFIDPAPELLKRDQG